MRPDEHRCRIGNVGRTDDTTRTLCRTYFLVGGAVSMSYLHIILKITPVGNIAASRSLDVSTADVGSGRRRAGGPRNLLFLPFWRGTFAIAFDLLNVLLFE